MEWRRWAVAAVPALLGVALLGVAVREVVQHYERRDWRTYRCVDSAQALTGYFVRTEECVLDMSKAFVEVVEGRPVGVFAPLASLLNDEPAVMWMELDSPELLDRLSVRNWDEIDLVPYVRVGPFVGQVTEPTEAELETFREIAPVRHVLREGREPPSLSDALASAACFGLFGFVFFGLAYWLGVVLYRP